MKKIFSQQAKEQIFIQLYEMYYASFCLYAKRFIEDLQTREDIVSEVFASLWDKIELVDMHSDSIVGYVKNSVKNACLNHLKHREYELKFAENIRILSPVYETEPDSIYNLNDLYKMLNETLKKLPKHYRNVFVKSFFEEKTYAEIAEELDISVKSVNRYKQKTMDSIREALKRHFLCFTLF